MAPNLTIYKKLRADLGDPSNPKYVFRGLDKFINAPRVIDGDNYEEFRQLSMHELLQPVIISRLLVHGISLTSGESFSLSQ